jgi:hypothetical protein
MEQDAMRILFAILIALTSGLPALAQMNQPPLLTPAPPVIVPPPPVAPPPVPSAVTPVPTPSYGVPSNIDTRTPLGATPHAIYRQPKDDAAPGEEQVAKRRHWKKHRRHRRN